jgi:putative flippase GtrA
MNLVMKNTLVKYIISGCTAALVNLTTLHFLDVYSGFHYLLSVNIAFITAFFYKFLYAEILDF